MVAADAPDLQPAGDLAPPALGVRGAGYSTDAFTGQEALQRSGVIIAVLTVAVFAITLMWSIRRLAARKVTFWEPLSAGVLMSIVQMVLVLGVLFGDAAFVQSILDGSGPSL